MKQYVLSVYISNALYRRISMAQTLISWSEFLGTMFSLFKEANSILISQKKNLSFQVVDLFKHDMGPVITWCFITSYSWKLQVSIVYTSCQFKAGEIIVDLTYHDMI